MPQSSAPDPSLSNDEVARFSSCADQWWNEGGAFSALHRINHVRLEYITDRLTAHHVNLRGKKVLDVGCGGGLLAEPLAQQGAQVVGIDASAKTIEVARRHAETAGMTIDYRAISIGEMARSIRLAGGTAERFDVITAMEVIEHTADVDAFVAALSALLKPNGLLFVSTLNRTMRSYMLGIVAAEYVLGWVPAGTHEWQKFVRPSEITEKLAANEIQTDNLMGVVFDPIRREFVLRPHDLRVNYMLSARKEVI